MTPEVAKHILTESFSAKVEGNTYHVDAERNCVLLLEHNNGIMQINGVISIDFGDALMSVSTDEDTYFLMPESIFGLKGRSPDQISQRPGFRRP